MHILFYNVENLFDTVDDTLVQGDESFTADGDKFWDEEHFQVKLARLSEAITLFEKKLPAMIGLAEIENRFVLEQLVQTPLLESGKYEIIHFDSNDPRGIDVALLVNRDIYKIVDTQKLIVHVPDEPFFETRDILKTYGEYLGKPLYCFVNHWPSRKEGKMESENRRIAAAKLLRKEVDELLTLDPKANILIMGDFNETPNDFTMREILRAKGQHEQKPNDLINLLIEEENNDLGSHVHRGDWMVFDQMIVSQGLLQGKNGLEIEKNNAYIFKHPNLLFTYPNGTQKPNATYAGDTYHGGYSDHLPVFVTIKKTK